MPVTRLGTARVRLEPRYPGFFSQEKSMIHAMIVDMRDRVPPSGWLDPS